MIDFITGVPPMSPQKTPSSFAGKRKALVGSPTSLPQNDSDPQKPKGSGVEKFGYSKMWKASKLVNLIWPFFLILLVLVFSILVLQGLATFKWWFPLALIALIGWTVMEVRTYLKTRSFVVVLSEEAIRVNQLEARWADIVKVEQGKNGDRILHGLSGTILTIPAQTDAIAYIRGFVESHTKNIGTP
jgi:hypothetical protein